MHAQNMGGVDQVFRDYNQVLIDNGNELALVISDNGKDDYNLPGIKKIYKLKNFNQILDIIHLLFIIYSFKPQIIICHTNRTMSWMKWIKFIIPAKTIAVNHSPAYKKSLHCEYIFSVNKEIMDLIIKDGKSPKHSIFMPNMIRITPDIKFINKKFSTPIRIGMFGRFEPRKGFDILIKAAAILKEKNLPFKLIIGGFSIAGCSYNENTIKNLVTEYRLNDQTEFVGVVKNKPEFFDKVDIFCVPSNEEPFGMVIIESFLNSTPVISSATNGGKLIRNSRLQSFGNQAGIIN
jgi:glycosyltransferase involved in cell wall biosynthesis